ncbi:MAG: hypothetical protein E6K08_01245 [Methanobacteriota archaeon]|nr:MAG: hypothetical protein E6K08_01245 [Euryarchaeota archaeon]TLZ80176.1 MAG: hypothetical protein E6K11_05570 [Euryarchaeota archaeon]
MHHRPSFIPHSRSRCHSNGGGRVAMRGGLPDEILRFFRGGGGHSLIIKGAPGAGKSMFALQLATELHDSFAAFYVSPRVSHESVLRQFPAIAPSVLRKTRARPPPASPTTVVCPACGASIEVTPKERPMEATCSVCGRTSRFAARTELNRLIVNIEEGPQPPSFPLYLPEIEMAYEAVDENFARYPQLRSLILIDPIDALDDDYDIRSWRLVTTLQKDLVENSGAGLVYIVNSVGEQKIDYLVDAVVTMVAAGGPTSEIRILDIVKLRGRPVQQRRYYFMVHHGRLWEAQKDFLDWMERS